MESLSHKFSTNVTKKMVLKMMQTEKGRKRVKDHLEEVSRLPGPFEPIARQYLATHGFVDFEIFFADEPEGRSFFRAKKFYFGNPSTAVPWTKEDWNLGERFFLRNLTLTKKPTEDVSAMLQDSHFLLFSRENHYTSITGALPFIVQNGLGGGTLTVRHLQKGTPHAATIIKLINGIQDVVIETESCREVTLKSMMSNQRSHYDLRSLTFCAGNDRSSVEFAFEQLHFVKYHITDVDFTFDYQFLLRLKDLWTRRKIKCPTVKLTLTAPRQFYNRFQIKMAIGPKHSYHNKHLVYDERISDWNYIRMFLHTPPEKQPVDPPQYYVQLFFVESSYSWISPDFYFKNREHCLVKGL
ncbi:hypothetical protein QR680_000193 [Steinernema hermaphroditum]|uniref:Uncharacterized protein n=1 Tax=Steinernema hermaphroditum TaxID=289476 RepID=A0AA39GVB0_9BILA|nr:hypothetical protein QR680_000193 [Steinernema hermaphroditum]